MSLLILDSVEKTYKRGSPFTGKDTVHALRPLSLSVPENGWVGLIGRRGSGKSTLGRIALGVEKPDRGTVLYRKQNIATLKGNAYTTFRREVQTVFQNALASVNPRWQVKEILAEPLRNYVHLSRKDLKQRVISLLESVGLCANDYIKYPHQFSGGQLQRVCIARALASKPRLIVLDEAVSSLDMLVQSQIMELLEKIQKESGTVYLFISHDLRIVFRYCQRIHFLDNGTIIQTIDTRSHEHIPLHESFKKFIDSCGIGDTFPDEVVHDFILAQTTKRG